VGTWRGTLAIGLAFVLAIGAAFYLGTRASRRAHRIHSANEPIHGWMSVPFIAHSHGVPPPVLFDAIGITPMKPRDRRPVRELARELHKPVPEVIAELQHAIDSAKQPPGGAPK
jgi:hypothetical protein